MKAREIMTPDPRVVTPDETLSAAAQIMRELDVGIVPVVNDMNGRTLRGVITDRDIAVRHVAEKHGDDCRVGDHMSDNVVKVGPDDDVDDVMQRMGSDQLRRIPVVEDDGRVIGIIAQADVALDVGNRRPGEVERTLQRVSEPGEPRR